MLCYQSIDLAGESELLNNLLALVASDQLSSVYLSVKLHIALVPHLRGNSAPCLHSGSLALEHQVLVAHSPMQKSASILPETLQLLYLTLLPLQKNCSFCLAILCSCHLAAFW